MVWIILFIVGAIALYSFWAWVIKHITRHQSSHWIWMHILIVGVLSTAMIGVFPMLVEMLWINQKAFINSMDYKTIGSYCVYLLVCWLTMYVGYVHAFPTSNFVRKIIIFVLSFALIAWWWVALAIPWYIIYFSLVAFGEEYIKYAFWFSLYQKLGIHHTDLLLFTIISGFAFAFIENGVYARYAIEPAEWASLMQKLWLAFKVLVQRWIINVSVHAFFTGIIGWFTLVRPKETPNAFKTIIWIMLWSCIHILFNSLLSKWVTFVMPIVVLASYIMISFLLFKADTLFVEPWALPWESKAWDKKPSPDTGHAVA